MFKKIRNWFYEDVSDVEYKRYQMKKDATISAIINTSGILVFSVLIAFLFGDVCGVRKADKKIAELENSDPYKLGYDDGFVDGSCGAADWLWRLTENDEFKGEGYYMNQNTIKEG